MRIFYDHLIEVHIGDLIVEIERFKITNEERDQLISILDNIIHYRVLDLILSELEREDQELFLANFIVAPYNKGILRFLEKKSPEIEEKIDNEVRTIKNEILFEILLS